jgi:dipeptidyl aminopeptidase/acylaminoacyl peptidase
MRYLVSFFLVAGLARAQETPLRQGSPPTPVAPSLEPLSLRDAARDDRWLGVGVRNVRWSPDGAQVYFQWSLDPKPEEDPELDLWFRAERSGARAANVPENEVHLVPAESVSWSVDGRYATWSRKGSLYIYDGSIRRVLSLEEPIHNARMRNDSRSVHFMLGEDLFEYALETGRLRQITRKEARQAAQSEAEKWLEQQQLDLFERHRAAAAREEALTGRERERDGSLPQPIPLEEGWELHDVVLSPDGRYVSFRAEKPNREREPTVYLDYATRSGAAEANEARAKVGSPSDLHRTGMVVVEPGVASDDVEVKWVDYGRLDDRPAIVYGPYWSLEGDRALVQVVSLAHKDRWIGELDLESGRVDAITHDHDDAWLGGPPPVAGYLEPALFEWLPGGSFVFASERTGWSHLYRVDRDGTIVPLTSGEWEVRDARLSRDRSLWLLTASREHPSDDHLYLMPAMGGDLTRLTTEPGRNTGFLSPDGKRLAVLFSHSVRLPDLFLRDPRPGAPEKRVTVSGTDNYYRYRWVEPEIVSFAHPDGGLVWAALFLPPSPAPERAGILHIHGGGYRQFSHRGWSVYGYDYHVGLIQYLVQEGYTVLDVDYRGSAGFGRDYRTDIYRSMGVKDVESAVSGARYLVAEHGVDEGRIGIYGISYGGFMTLMSLFRYPGVFAAGVANAAVSDWAHYSDLWTSRILSTPVDDPEAYAISSPINHAEGLDDPLLIVHGLIDDNVHFQDAARVVQKLIELEKDFEVAFYPMERHIIESESSRLDYTKRLVRFFAEHLRRDRRTTP